MATKKYCAYNRSTECVLSRRINTVDTKLDPLYDTAGPDDLVHLNSDSDLWLIPFRGLPTAHVSTDFDLVYLDEDYRVVQGIESYPAAALAPFKGQAASALVLSPYTIHTSRTRPGDQLLICDAEELAQHLAAVPVASTLTPAMNRTEPPSAPQNGKWSAIPNPVVDHSGNEQPSIQPLEAEAKIQFTAEEIDSVTSRILRFSEESRRPPAPIPAPTLAKITELFPELPRGDGSLATSQKGDRSRQQQASVQPVDVTALARFSAEEHDSVTTRLMRLSEASQRSPVPVLPPLPTKITELRVEKPSRNGSSAPSPTGDRSRELHAEVQPVNANALAKFSEDEIDSLISQRRGLSEESRHSPAPIPVPTPAKITEIRAEKHPGNGSFTPSTTGNHSQELQGAVQPLDAPAQGRFSAEEIHSVTSMLMRLSEERRRPNSPIPVVTPVPSGAKITEFPVEVPHGNADFSPSPTVDQPRIRQDERQFPAKQEKIARLAPIKESMKVWWLRRGDDAQRLFQRISVSISSLISLRSIESLEPQQDSLVSRIVKWVNYVHPPTDGTHPHRRKSMRRPLPGLVAHFWTGGAPEAHAVRDISDTGVFLITQARWSPGTLVRMTLQMTGTPKRVPENEVCVLSKIVRLGLDGVGYEFVLAYEDSLRRFLAEAEALEARGGAMSATT